MTTSSGRSRVSWAAPPPRGCVSRRRRSLGSLDWPLSREEKKGCALLLYEKDIQAANSLLQSKDAALGVLRHELTTLRRTSLASTSAGDLEGERGAASESSGSLGASSSGWSGESRPTTPEAAQVGDACPAQLDSDEGPPAEQPGGQAPPGADARKGRGAAGAAEARLRVALTRFYEQERRLGCHRDASVDIDELVRRYAGEHVPELWARIATKYALSPLAALQWLGRTLEPLAPVQWPKGQVPEDARRALDALGAQLACATEAAAGPPGDIAGPRAEALRVALKDNSLDAVRALSLRGCPCDALRPRLWRALLGLRTDGLAERRSSYGTLCLAALAAPEEGGPPAQLGEEVAAEAAAAWRGDALALPPSTANAVLRVALTAAHRRGAHSRGACEMAAVLMLGLAPAASEERLGEAEADVFWCLTALLDSPGVCAAGEAEMAEKASRMHKLLQSYDPQLAHVLASQGLSALPATRMGNALCTRSGFGLSDCMRLWDTLLADPCRFGFCDYLVVAVLLLGRRDLLLCQGDAGGLAEALLGAARKVAPSSALRVAHSICAFERRCGPGSNAPFPARGSAQEAAWLERLSLGAAAGGFGELLSEVSLDLQTSLEVAHSQLYSFWGTLRRSGVGALKVGRKAVRCSFPMAHPKCTGHREDAEFEDPGQCEMSEAEVVETEAPLLRRRAARRSSSVTPTTAVGAALEAGII